jgi:hypothetical protein
VTYHAQGGLFATRTFRIDATGLQLACRSSDPSIRSGIIESLVGFGTVDCISGLTKAEDSGTYTVAWNNGRTSKIFYAETSQFAVGQSSGTVLSGEFKGLALHLRTLEGAIPDLCFRDQGQTAGLFLETSRLG